MSGLVESQQDSLRGLVKRLIEEHRDFSRKEQRLSGSIRDDADLSAIAEIFSPLRESLIGHMLVEETDIFPEVSNQGLFSERISEIMQQHLDITAALDEMRSSIHGKDFQRLSKAFDELVHFMQIHFRAEEKEVFPLVV